MRPTHGSTATASGFVPVSTVAILASGVTGFGVLRRASDSFPTWLPWAILVATVIGAAGWLALPWVSAVGARRYLDGSASSKLSGRVLSLRVGVVGVVAAAMLAGPSAYSAYTIAHANAGSVVAAGPKTDSGMGDPGRQGGPGSLGQSGADGQDGTSSPGQVPSNDQGGGPGGTPPSDGAGQSTPGGTADAGTTSDNSSDGMPGASSNGSGGSSDSAAAMMLLRWTNSRSWYHRKRFTSSLLILVRAAARVGTMRSRHG